MYAYLSGTTLWSPFSLGRRHCHSTCVSVCVCTDTPCWSVCSIGHLQQCVPAAAAAVRTPASSGLRRRETTITPDGRQRLTRGLAKEGPRSAPQASRQRGFQQVDDLRTTRRKASAVASAGDVKTTAQLAVGAEALTPRPRARAGAGAQNSGNPGVSTSTVTGGGGHTVNTRNIRLEQFRCVEIERDLSSAAAAVVAAAGCVFLREG